MLFIVGWISVLFFYKKETKDNGCCGNRSLEGAEKIEKNDK